MIADRDIRRAANLLIREHGADAEIVAAIESVADIRMDPESPRASAWPTHVQSAASGLAKELRLGRGRRACREETEAAAPETSAAPPPGSRRDRKTTVGDDGNITRPRVSPRLTGLLSEALRGCACRCRHPVFVLQSELPELKVAQHHVARHPL